MKPTSKILFLFLLIISISTGLNAQRINLDSIDILVNKLMTDFETPGLSIGIVQNDSVIFLKGYGTCDISIKSSVDENTIFGIGSISKSFTALTLGILVDEGKIDWDDKVKKYIPYFELYSPYVSDNFTIRDLLTHRSGLKGVSGGSLWYHSDNSRVEIIKKMKYLKPISSFRSTFAYQNIMYMVAGEIVDVVTDMTWDDFLQKKVFNKIEMINSTSVSTTREINENLAQPHILDDNNKLVRIEQEKGDNLAAAGFIYSSSMDMANYIRLLLNNGVFNKDTIIHEVTLNEFFEPQIGVSRFHLPFYNEFTSYGFGWFLSPTNGHKIITHSGGIDGMVANLIMVKDLNFGVVVMTNSDDFSSIVLTNILLGKVLNDKSYDKLYEMAKSYHQTMFQNKQKAKNEIENSRIHDTKFSLPIGNYSGTYNDKMYGDIFIDSLNNRELEISFSHTKLFEGKLVHWHYDTFKIDWYDIRVPDGFLTFNFNSKHEIEGIKLEQENLLDVDFTELKIKRLDNQ